MTVVVLIIPSFKNEKLVIALTTPTQDYLIDTLEEHEIVVPKLLYIF